MLNSKDLRLGNFVKDRNGKIIRIDFIEHTQEGYDTKFGEFIDEENVLSEYSDYAQAIPITKDWFIKFGFKSNNNKFWELGSFGVIINFNIDIYLFGWVGLCKINDVHELQNLYHVLTKKDLILI